MGSTFLITGGAGFIGSNLIKYLLKHRPEIRLLNLDKLTYAGNLENLKEVENHPQYTFIKGDITDRKEVFQIFEKYSPQVIFHLAAESHVDRSILEPGAFIQTNINGTFALLEGARHFWKNKDSCRFIHVSTDEVFGSLGEKGAFEETTPYTPNSPYSASKAGSDHLVRAYYKTYDLPVVITNCCNNYGPYQFPEKLIPLMISNALQNKPLPVYGDGKQVRDWIYVEDHCKALDLVYEKGSVGETYCIGTRNETYNLDMVRKILALLSKPESLIQYVKDRPGHDRRYAINPSKLESLGFSASFSLEKGLEKTIQWYVENQKWIQAITSGEYKNYYKRQYGERLGDS